MLRREKGGLCLESGVEGLLVCFWLGRWEMLRFFAVWRFFLSTPWSYMRLRRTQTACVVDFGDADLGNHCLARWVEAVLSVSLLSALCVCKSNRSSKT